MCCTSVRRCDPGNRQMAKHNHNWSGIKEHTCLSVDDSSTKKHRTQQKLRLSKPQVTFLGSRIQENIVLQHIPKQFSFDDRTTLAIHPFFINLFQVAQHDAVIQVKPGGGEW